jgi:methyl-accepting chemotaxis protein
MISFSFNLALILSSFLLCSLLYYGFYLIKKFNVFYTFSKNNEPYLPIQSFKQKLSFFLISLIPIYFLDSLIRLITSTTLLSFNIFIFQGILSLTYLLSLFLLINFVLYKYNLFKKIFLFFLVLAIPLSLFWLKTNIFDGFFPVISNYFLVYIAKATWVFFGVLIACILYLSKKDELQEKIIEIYLNATIKYLLLFFIGNIISLGVMTMLMDYYYVLSSGIALVSLFFIFIMLTSNNIQAEYYEKPYKIIRQKIITRIMLSITILIVVSLEVVNYATIFIIQNELKSTKEYFFEVVTKDINKVFKNTYTEIFFSFSKYLEKFRESKQPYYVGITIFNDMSTIKDLKKIVILNKEGIPIIEATNEYVNFNYSAPDNLNIYKNYKENKLKDGYFFSFNQENNLNIYKNYKENILKDGYFFSFNQENNLIEISTIIRDKNDDIAFYIISFFNPASLFSKINQFLFEPEGEIMILKNNYEQLYSTKSYKNLKSLLNQGAFFEYYSKDPLTNLNILVRQPEKLAFAGIHKAQYQSFFFTVLAIIIFLIISFLYIKTIENPIKILQKGAKELGEGNLDYEIVIKEKNEFYDLASSFNQMIQELKKLQKEQLKHEQKLSITRMSVGLNHEINNPVSAISMGAQLSNRILSSLEKNSQESMLNQLLLLKKTNEQIINETKKITKILKDIQQITSPIIEEYVDGTKMIKVKFD